MDTALPNATKSKMERLEPKIPVPYRLSELPMRDKLRMLIVLPNSKQSKTDKLLPNFISPYTDNELPMRSYIMCLIIHHELYHV